jgi:rhodanese-related sulfurtransferase
LALAGLFVPAFPALAQSPSQPSFSVLDAATTQEIGQIILAREAFTRMRIGTLLLVDIRTPEEWQETGVPEGARPITAQQNNTDFLKQILAAAGSNRSRTLALIDRNGSRTSKLIGDLRRAGFTQVLNVADGIAGNAYGPGWVKSGLPMQRSAGASGAQR